MKYVLGVDVGGTNIKFGLVNKKGDIIARSNMKTSCVKKGCQNLIKAIVAEGESLFKENKLKRKNILGVGIGLPGLIDIEKGFVHYLPNISGWNNVPLKSIFEKKIKLPTFIDNDVNVITLAEAKFGAGKGVNNLVCITLGTGVGSGLVLDGRLYRGEGFAAGELGHMPLNEKGDKCTCGGSGCLETLVGNKRLLKKARSVFKRNVPIEEISPLARQGDKRAIKFWEETALHIGNGLVGVVNLLNPRLIVIGGGISNNHKYLFNTIRQVIKKRAMRKQASMVRIVRAKLGNDAGIMGAQALVNNSIKNR